jgi:hypothetical protein
VRTTPLQLPRCDRNKDTLAGLGQDGAEALLAFDQGAVRQILAVAVQQIEGDEHQPVFEVRRFPNLLIFNRLQS